MPTPIKPTVTAKSEVNLVTLALENHAGRNTHECIGDEVGQCSELRKGIARAELVLDDNAHRTRKVRNERYHEEQREHHGYRKRITLFLYVFHSDLRFFGYMIFSFSVGSSPLALGDIGAQVHQRLAVG